jgi:hypothetical protein
LVIYNILYFLLILTGTTLARLGIHNYGITQLISWSYVIFYSLIFYNILNSLKLKRFVLFSTILQVCLIVLINVTIEPITVHPSLTYMVINTGIIINTLLVFKQIYDVGEVEFLEKQPIFWFNSATFLLYTGTIFLFLFSNYQNYKLIDKSVSDFFSIAKLTIYILNEILVIIALLLLRGELKKHNS